MMNPLSLEYFMEACGVLGPLQLSVERFGRPEGGRRVLQGPFGLIGRDPGTCVPLVEPQISRRHAYLQFLGGRLFCLDLGSRTGVYWNQEAKKSGWLEPAQSIRIGTYTVRYEEGGDERETPVGVDWNPLTAPTLDKQILPEVNLDFVNGNPRRSWEMNCAMALIGLAADCRIRLRGSNISFHHGSLVRTPLGVWIIDLLGREGIRVNGEKIRWAYLNNGDRIQIGTLVIRIWHNAPLPMEGFSEARLRSGDRFAADENNRAFLEDVHALDSTEEPGDFALISASLNPDGVSGDAPTQPLLAASSGGTNYALSPALDKTELKETLLMPLVNQFADMQKQMSDQFEQAILMVVKMFTEMQQDQVDLMRKEVDRLQDLTQELHSLQNQLTPQPAVLNPQTLAEVTPEKPPEIKAASLPESISSFAETAKPLANAGEPVEASANKNEKPYGETKPEPEIPSPPFETSACDVNGRLFQRIEEIQQERQSRMQKILSFLSGK